MRRSVILTVLAMVAAACTNTGETTTTTPLSATTSTGATTFITTTTTTRALPTTTSTTLSPAPPVACQETWPQDIVLAVLGQGWSFAQASESNAGCQYVNGSLTAVLSSRPGGQAEFEAAKAGAAVTGDITEVGICDGMYLVTVQNSITIGETLDLARGAIYNVTMSGILDTADSVTELLRKACK